MPTLVAVCRVHRLLPDPGSVGVTAIDKRPVAGPVGVRALGLYGDVQADRKDHGGADKALYAYAEEAARAWEDELGREVVPGLFGENLRTAGLDVDGAELGERWRVGGRVLLEVTMPRTPCATFGRRLGEQHWVRRFTERGLPGAYLRVLQRGSVTAGDAVEVVHRPGHGVSVAGFLADPARHAARVLALAEEGAVDVAADVLAVARRAAAQGSGEPAARGGGEAAARGSGEAAATITR
ncbi:MOSC domain-containing protein [Quadrisphaera sp. DSM 44207]|uniref:MOSC domain-containing protein n=1 Tax=Quadrisphaera sp. DSM 44207 TaxID=1881057 RepID=UPI000884D14D|nr:MOSC domain-containing protein [Quadrisphaera sp. DSM 44207]SDQ04873.1 MOSC domain-containing protein YiiM [Quadrisphaera sp. DSM 44207]